MPKTKLDIEEAKEEIEEQYRILKEEEEEEHKRRILLLIALFFMAFAVSLTGATLSFVSYRNTINGNPNNKIESPSGSNTEEKNITILYNAGNEFEAKDIEPGWISTASKSFYIENKGTIAGNYQVVLKDISYDFEHLEDLLYSVKCNGKDVITSQPVPSDTSIILDKEVIEPNTTKKYEITFEYKETNESQDEDMGKFYKMFVDINGL